MINATVKHHASNTSQNGSTLLAIWRDLYVDDSTSGFDTVFVAYDFYLKVKSIIHDAAFNLQNPLSLKFLRINEQDWNE